MIKTPIIFSKKCLEYGRHLFPENPSRVETSYNFLKNFGCNFIEPEIIQESVIFKAHSKEYIDKLKQNKISDIDTPAIENIYFYAYLAASSAITASKRLGFSMMRPPGHHVGINGKTHDASTRGFCYINSIAVAVKLLDKPTLILDIDGHHGNGTQEIFLGNKNVVYLSLHRSSHYPGTGYFSIDNCYNFPLKENCGENYYLKTFEIALEQVKDFEYEYIAVSAGFDTHMNDLASLGLSENTYYEIGKRINALNKPTFFVLEGGYLKDKLGKDIASLLTAFNQP